MNIVPRSKPFADVAAELLSRGHRVRFRAEGASMHPTIRGGEMITVEPVSELKIGDIALYRTERGLIAHRIVEIRKGNGNAPVLFTRGEGSGSTAEAVHEQQVLGKVRAVERNGHSIDLGSRWAKIRCRARSLACLARDWGAKSGGIHIAGMFLLVFVLLAVVPSAARANVTVLGEVASAGSGGGNSCTLAVTGKGLTADLILISLAFQNVGSISSVTSTSGTVTVVQPLFGITNQARLAIYQLTGFSGASLTITGNFSGANGFVCAAVGFGGVSSVGTPWGNTCSVAATDCKAAGTTSQTLITGPSPGPGGVIFDTVAMGNNVSATAVSPQVQQFQVTGSRPAEGSVAPPQNTMSWTLSGSSPWAEAAVPLNPIFVTEVQPTSLAVTQHGGRNLIELTTGRAVASLGFNVYREQNGQRVRLNSSLIAGTALLAGSETNLTATHVQTAWDAPLAKSSSVSYWVEEVDVHGQHTWRGPVTPKPAGPMPANSVGSAAFTTATAREGRVSLLSRVGREGSAPGAAVHSAPHEARAPQKTKTPSLTKTQYALAAGPAVKIGVQSEGWYRVAWSDLIQAGLDPIADANTLQLFAEGVEQPIVVQGQSNIQFYGTGLDTTWSDTRVYWLTWGRAAGRRVPADTTQRKSATGPPSFPFTVEWKPRTVYFAALLNGDADNFFGPALTSGEPVSQSISLTHVDGNSADGAQLRVALQGVSMAPHNVGVALNGTPVGTVAFSDQKEGVVTLTVPATFLLEGQNLLTLTVDGGEEDVSLVDAVELSYPRRYTADNDSLRFTAPSDQSETIGGFSTSQILVLDITDPEQVTRVAGGIISQGGSYGVTIVPRGGGTRTLLALTTAAEAKPARITPHHPSSWHAPQPGMDMVMISHADFLPALGPLTTLHQGQGLKVATIDVEDIYDEFNFGEKSPYALKDFLSTANAQWQRKPRFVLLMGDATLDPRNYLGVGNFDFVPTYLVDTSMLETASDDWFADFSGQGIPQMAIGRLPVRTAQDASTLVSKVVDYEQSGSAPWQQQVLLVAGQNDSENDFQGLTAAVQALVPVGMTVSEITEGSGANQDLLNSLNVQGAAVVNYVGHGAQTTWAGGLFSATDASGLTNGAMVPFVVSMTCLNGYFQDVFATSLAKSLIGAPGGGALAVWASSGLTDSGSQGALNQGLMKALFGTSRTITIGEAAAAAKTAVSDLDVRRTWILFGDPAIRLHK